MKIQLSSDNSSDTIMVRDRDERTRVSEVCPCPSPCLRFSDMPVSEVMSESEPMSEVFGHVRVRTRVRVRSQTLPISVSEVMTLPMSVSESVSEVPKILYPSSSLLRTWTRTRTHVRSRVRSSQVQESQLGQGTSGGSGCLRTIKSEKQR